MKHVEGTTYVIGEDDNYDLFFCREEDENLTPHHLFLVTLIHKKDPEKVPVTSHHYVLAEDEEGAIGQATCGIKGIDYLNERTNALENGSLKVTVAQIPFQIRGWNAQIF